MTKQIVSSYRSARKRLFLLDYDGTLTPFVGRPEQARPTPSLIRTLSSLSADPYNSVVIVSGRSARDLESWFGALPIDLVAEHGSFLKLHGHEWQPLATHEIEWQRTVHPLLEAATSAVSGSFVEEKATALVWHYRPAHNQDLAQKTAEALHAQLQTLAREHNFRSSMGHLMVEARVSGSNKGTAVSRWLGESWDFVLAAGDDVTDEDLFRILPPEAYSVKIGSGDTAAQIRVPSPAAFVKLLASLAE